MATITITAIYVQILLGALMRHTGSGLAIPDFPLALGRIIPPLGDSNVAIHFAHRVWAMGVVTLVIATLIRVLRAPQRDPRLVRPAVILTTLIAAQIVLGAFTVWTAKAPVLTTFHVVVGSASLATALVLAVRAVRMRRRRAVAPPGLAAESVA